MCCQSVLDEALARIDIPNELMSIIDNNAATMVGTLVFDQYQNAVIMYIKNVLALKCVGTNETTHDLPGGNGFGQN
jgi:hypothetical protein